MLFSILLFVASFLPHFHGLQPTRDGLQMRVLGIGSFGCLLPCQAFYHEFVSGAADGALGRLGATPRPDALGARVLVPLGPARGPAGERSKGLSEPRIRGASWLMFNGHSLWVILWISSSSLY